MLHRIVALIIFYCIKCLGALARWDEHIQHSDCKKPKLYFVWHCSIPSTVNFMSYYSKKYQLYGMVSGNRSTVLLGAILKMSGAKIIYGSKSKGAISSVREMLRAIKIQDKKPKMFIIGIDGPRGPSFHIKDSTLLEVAKKHDMEVRFMTCMSNKIWKLNTWDSAYILKPFSRSIFIDKIILNKDEMIAMTPEEMRCNAEARMQNIFDDLCKNLGQEIFQKGVIKQKRQNITAQVHEDH